MCESVRYDSWRKLISNLLSLVCVTALELVCASVLMKVYPWNLLTILIEYIPVIFDAIHFAENFEDINIYIFLQIDVDVSIGAWRIYLDQARRKTAHFRSITTFKVTKLKY